MKRLFCLMLSAVLCFSAAAALAGSEIIQPAFPVPDYVTWLLEIAGGEVGYTEYDHGRSKFGEWVGDPYAQWCAEYLCWSVDQVDQQHGTQLLRNVYPMYSGTNTGRDWFIRHGRYIVRNGSLNGWGYQWLKGEDHFLHPGDYIPQPGDWIFFTWTSNDDTDHVAMVEYCTREEDGSVLIHVLEGNNPDCVQRNTYPLLYSRILGFGTVHDAADWTMRMGNSGEKVRQLQDKLVSLGLLTPEQVDGIYGQATSDAVKAIQTEAGIKANGIANLKTQRFLDRKLRQTVYDDPATWRVAEDDEDDDDLSGLLDFGSRPTAPADDEDDLFP